MTDLASVSSLDDPVRRRLYEVVRERAEPVGRDEAAAAAGIGRALAVYHLDKLVEADLLTASYQRPAGRGGPGGRGARPSCTRGPAGSSPSACRPGSTNSRPACWSGRSAPTPAGRAGPRWA